MQSEMQCTKLCRDHTQQKVVQVFMHLPTPSHSHRPFFFLPCRFCPVFEQLRIL